ncbi:UDP-2,4-diacetamido-2,4,6-trideoxy-beta-L-altropyranose hydrolase [Agarivorans sp. Z349TD_8]|uniref:UDP-2,4-diacetamido-2,4, 6-trideoxy-beta-L-altropyranose hydrolase n=1 Tax=Agarivorans sp. Z349TD_8 TaxID=3421434 RepID=UPI003D7DF176
MNVAFRVDASFIIGSGHVYRCLSLAHQLKKNGHQVYFISAEQPGHLNALITRAGFSVFTISEPMLSIDPENSNSWLGRDLQVDANETIRYLNQVTQIDYLIIDHYGINSRWETRLRDSVKNILVIDDLANRSHNCDILIDQTYGRIKQNYHSLVSPETELLLGSDYALIRDEFLIAKPSALTNRSLCTQIKKILINLGGTDRTNVSEFLLKLLNHSSIANDIKIAIIVGPNNPNHRSLINATAQSRFQQCTVLNSISNMAEILSHYDLAIGASGASAWERCSLGLPSINIELASNQKEICAVLAKQGAALSLGEPQHINSETLEQAIQYCQEHYSEMVNSALDLIDGKGVTRTTLSLYRRPLLDGRLAHLKLASTTDCKLLYQWQCEPSTRQYALNPHAPSWVEHKQWFYNQLSKTNSYLYMLVSTGEPLGMLRLDQLADQSQYEISIITAPNVRRTGVAKAALQLARDCFPKADFYATVLPENKASNQLFQKQNYHHIQSNRYRQKADGSH